MKEAAAKSRYINDMVHILDKYYKGIKESR